MQPTTYTGNGNSLHGFKPERKEYREPKIKATVTVEGETLYLGIDGKHYRPALFNAMFKVQRGEIKKGRYKGENPDKSRI